MKTDKTGQFKDEYSLKELMRRKIEQRRAIAAEGLVVITYAASRMQVSAPYNKDWVNIVRSFEAKWRRRSSIWSIDRRYQKQALVALENIYGAGNLRYAKDLHKNCTEYKNPA